ncbi:hypothetical protein AMTRI_Chr12g236920 [Amborella trichopoda]
MAGLEGLIGYVFEGCLSQSDMGIERRPYQQKLQLCPSQFQGHISYPIRRSWSESSLASTTSSSTIPRPLKDHQSFPSSSRHNISTPPRGSNTFA